MKRTALTLTFTLALLFTVVAGTLLVNLASAQDFEAITIKDDGSIDPSTAPIQHNGDVYTLTGNISGGIQVQKSYIVIDGGGYAVVGNDEYGGGVDLSNDVGQAPSRSSICNVTVKNLKIINCYYAIGNENTNNNTFIGNYISDCDTGFWITGSSNNTLFHNTVKDCVTGISINYGSGGNVIIENNIISSWSVWLSPDPAVDRNYWGDYVTRFPNATEIDNSGIWDTPYSHGDKVIDYHPLTRPVVVPSNDENSTIPVVEPLPTSLVLAASGASLAVVGIGLFVYFKRRKQQH